MIHNYRYLRNHYQTFQPMPTCNIISENHGSDTWKRLVDKDCINVFIGTTSNPTLTSSLRSWSKTSWRLSNTKESTGKTLCSFTATTT